MSAIPSSRGVERVLAKCEACITAGNFYEAHQMLRTVYFRYNGQSKFAEAAEVLYKGALTLLKHYQFTSGADLSLLLLEVLGKSHSEVTTENIDRLATLFEKMDSNCPERQQYLAKSVTWTAKVNKEHRRGHPDLHQRIGVTFWQEKNYTQAHYHYIHSADGEGCAQMLLEFHVNYGYPSEVDLFITQAVLQYLCLQNKTTANSCFQAFTRKHPAIPSGPPYNLPLLNFIWMLLIALEGGKLAVFTVLCDKYQRSIKRDPNYKEYLDQIGQLFFGVPAPQKRPQGFFGGLLQSLLGGDTGSDEESDECATPVSNQSQRLATSNSAAFNSKSPASPSKPDKPQTTPDLD